jgi:hypothetical protein
MAPIQDIKTVQAALARTMPAENYRFQGLLKAILLAL